MGPALWTALLLQFWSEIITASGAVPTVSTATVVPTVTPTMDVLLTTEAILMVLNSSAEAVVQVPPGGTLLPATDHLNGDIKDTKYDQLLDELNNITKQSALDRTPLQRESYQQDNHKHSSDTDSHQRNISITSNRSIPEKFTHLLQSTISSSTQSDPITPVPPPAPTRKHVYVRGHLVTRHRERAFHPADTHPHGKDSKPENMHRTFIQDFRSEPGHQRRVALNPDPASKRTKKHSNTKQKKEKFYNYKLLYDTIKNKSDSRHKETEFYAWIFGAAMLTLGSLTTLTACFVFCFCGEKWRKRRQRRRFDKSGEYQRVDSVSSIVDNTNGQLDPILEEQLDNVTII